MVGPRLWHGAEGNRTRLWDFAMGRAQMLAHRARLQDIWTVGAFAAATYSLVERVACPTQSKLICFVYQGCRNVSRQTGHGLGLVGVSLESHAFEDCNKAVEGSLQPILLAGAEVAIVNIEE